ncbi:hypothetical protein [Haloferula sp. A504]|uniref:hypothetical protein n=1 Tax=Haloferula sp. A504 TaxID=3373601 RepID=UPI0031C89C19|nr:hypothetical protein [Verrucomicrobiaceae bacterium E54]
MYSLLKAFSTIAVTFGVTLILLAGVLWIYQAWHGKKYGPIPKGRMTIINLGMFILAALIALPISFAKINKSKRQSTTQRIALLAGQQMEMNRKRQEETVANLKPAGTSEPRPEVNPAEAEKPRALEARRKAEAVEGQAAAREQQEQRVREMRERHEAQRQQAKETEDPFDVAEDRPKDDTPPITEARKQDEDRQLEIRDRQAASRRHSERMRAMHEADYYEPPPGPASDTQRALDEKIIAANEELQDLKTEQEAYRIAYESARDEQKQLMNERPVDHDRLKLVSKTLHESMRRKIQMSPKIHDKRRELTTLLSERYKLGE